jgi:hypothetical protein
MGVFTFIWTTELAIFSTIEHYRNCTVILNIAYSSAIIVGFDLSSLNEILFTILSQIYQNIFDATVTFFQVTQFQAINVST